MDNIGGGSKTSQIFFPMPFALAAMPEKYWGREGGKQLVSIKEDYQPRRKTLIKLHLLLCQCHLVWSIFLDSEIESNILWEYPVKEGSQLKDQFQSLLQGDPDQGLILGIYTFPIPLMI